MKKKIAFFDFDGTITTKDTFLEFIKFYKGRLKFYSGFLANGFYLAGFKLKLFSNQQAKERILCYFFKGTPITEFNEQCERFCAQVLPALIRPGAVAEIEELKEKGFEIVVVSASPENWIRPWCGKVGASLIATCLETSNGFITGKLNGRNCRSEEKVNRILERHRMSDYEEIYTYGDSSGDLAMLKLGTRSYYKPFRK